MKRGFILLMTAFVCVGMISCDLAKKPSKHSKVYKATGKGISVGTATVYPLGDPKHKTAVYKSDVPVKDPGSKLKKDWWRTAVFYECYVRSFKDSDGDGQGDFKGLIEKLDYLKELGVGGIWLMPIMASADHSHGYQTADYRGVEADYGTMDDFKRLMDEAHKRGIGIIIDFVVNHVSGEHPFFKNARSDVNSQYRDWFCWTNVYPGQWETAGISDVWHDDGKTGYYYAGFVAGMPEWNFRNPDVLTYTEDNMRFWLNLGVDGFRFDAADHLIENGEGRTMNQPENYPIYAELRKVMDSYENRFTVCEATEPEYLGANKFHSGLAYGLNYAIMRTTLQSNPGDLPGWVEHYQRMAPQGSMYATFLANHDLVGGNRPFKQFYGNTNKCKLAASVLLTTPGIPFVYYGEEIAINQTQENAGDGALRTPMQWNTEKNAGFSTADRTYRPMNKETERINVAYEEKDPKSRAESL